MIYINEHIQDFPIEEALQTVSPERRIYALRYRRPLDQRLCLAAYKLLQKALHEEYGIEEPPQFTYGTHGKPMLKAHPDIHFNLSHCDVAAACVLSGKPVGIDVECIRPIDRELMAATMSKEEEREILSAASPAVAFARYWTMKESLLKLTGEGICSDIHRVLSRATNCKFMTETHEQKGYVMTCAFGDGD